MTYCNLYDYKDNEYRADYIPGTIVVQCQLCGIVIRFPESVVESLTFSDKEPGKIYCFTYISLRPELDKYLSIKKDTIK